MSVKIRLLSAVHAYGIVIAVLLIILGITAFGVAGQTYRNPPVETVTEETDRQTVSTELHTSATVHNDTPLYEAGRELRDMPVYYSNFTPNLTYQLKATGPADSSFDVDQRLVLHLQAARSGAVFWETRRVLAADSATVDDGVHWVNSTVNMTEIRAFIVDKRAAVGPIGTFAVQLHLNVTYETSKYSGGLSASTSLVTTERAYWLEAHPADSETNRMTDSREVRHPPDYARVGVLVGLGLLSFIGAFTVLRLYHQIDHERVVTERSHIQYEEWISNGEIPTKSEKEYVRVDSLEDLVDIAIDTSKRVIYDTELDAYGVVEGDLVYYYTTDGEGLTNWIDI